MAADPQKRFEAFLRELKCRDGEPLLRHLGQVVEQMLVQHQPAPTAVFEELSSKVAADRRRAPQQQQPPADPEEPRHICDSPEHTRDFVLRAAAHLVRAAHAGPGAPRGRGRRPGRPS